MSVFFSVYLPKIIVKYVKLLFFHLWTSSINIGARGCMDFMVFLAHVSFSSHLGYSYNFPSSSCPTYVHPKGS